MKTVYEIAHPITGVPVYIGITKDFKWRAYGHVSPSGKNRRAPIGQWSIGLKQQGLRPMITAIDEVCDSDYWERYYISLYRSWGFDLLNQDSGGVSGFVQGWSNRLRKSQALSGRKMTEERRLTHSKSMTGIVYQSKRKGITQRDLRGNVIEVFATMREAEIKTGCSDAAMGKSLRTGRPSAGFIWTRP
jgi:hypothetical protein